MKTSELTGAALDWAVAKCEEMLHLDNAETWLRDYRIGFSTRYSTVWSQGGPIIERERVSTQTTENHWDADLTTDSGTFIQLVGDTPLIAAMRCYVASKLGDTVDVPSELV